MNDPEMMTLMNTLLLSVVSVASLMISFFLKDLYRDYKNQAEKVNTLHRELDTQSKLFEELMQVTQQQLNRLYERLDEIDRQRRHWP